MNTALVICLLGAALCYVSGQSSLPVQDVSSSTVQDMSSSMQDSGCDCSKCEAIPPPKGNLDFSVCSMEVEACVLRHTSVTAMSQGSLGKMQANCFAPFTMCTQGIFTNLIAKIGQGGVTGVTGGGITGGPVTKSSEGNKLFSIPSFGK